MVPPAGRDEEGVAGLHDYGSKSNFSGARETNDIRIFGVNLTVPA